MFRTSCPSLLLTHFSLRYSSFDDVSMVSDLLFYILCCRFVFVEYLFFIFLLFYVCGIPTNHYALPVVLRMFNNRPITLEANFNWYITISISLMAIYKFSNQIRGVYNEILSMADKVVEQGDAKHSKTKYYPINNV